MIKCQDSSDHGSKSALDLLMIFRGDSELFLSLHLGCLHSQLECRVVKMLSEVMRFTEQRVRLYIYGRDLTL